MSFFKQYGVRIHNPEKACFGYTLFVSTYGGDAYLIDMEGNFLNRWAFHTRARVDAQLLENGNLLFAKSAPLTPESDFSHPRVGGWGIGGGIVEVDWDGNLMWKHVDTKQNHAFWRCKNGNTIYCIHVVTPKEIAYRVKGGLPGTEDRGMMWNDGFREVNPNGKTVWEWNAADHLDPETHLMCPVGLRGGWTHMNSIEEIPNGDILTSMRNIDTICIVDRKTGKIKWEWGPGEISHQHAPTFLENGNVLVFDNGTHRKNGSLISYSRAVEVNPATNKIEWEYKADPPQSFYSSLVSSARRLPNGNTLICEGMKGRLFEVTMEGEIVWEYLSPFYTAVGITPQELSARASQTFLNQSFRAYRFMPDYPGLEGKDLDPENLAWFNQLYGP